MSDADCRFLYTCIVGRCAPAHPDGSWADGQDAESRDAAVDAGNPLGLEILEPAEGATIGPGATIRVQTPSSSAPVHVAVSIDGAFVTSLLLDGATPGVVGPMTFPHGPHEIVVTALDFGERSVSELRRAFRSDVLGPKVTVHPQPLTIGIETTTVTFSAVDDVGVKDIDVSIEQKALKQRYKLAAAPFVIDVSGSAFSADRIKVVVTATDNLGNTTNITYDAFRSGPLGSACKADNHCESGICADNVCCQTRCDGACRRCDGQGQCVPVTSGTDPGACSGKRTCASDGVCSLTVPRVGKCPSTDLQSIADATASGIVRAMEGPRRSQLLGCLKDAFITGIVGESAGKPPGLTHPELMLSRVESALPNSMECSAAFGEPLVTSSPDDVLRIHETLLRQGALEAAASALGGIAERVGYRSASGHPELRTFAPSTQLKACALGILSDGATPLPNGRRRSTLSPEVPLAPFGSDLGRPSPKLECPPGLGLRGLWTGKLADQISNVGLQCAAGGAAMAVPTPASVGAVAVEVQECPAGAAVTGLAGVGDGVLSALNVLCSTSSAPIEEGLRWHRQCPAGMVVKGIRLRRDFAVRGLEVHCGLATTADSAKHTDLDRLGGDGGDSSFEDVCPSQTIVSGLFASHSTTNGVVRLSASCGSASPASSQQDWLPLQERGGDPFDESTFDRCGSGAAVGISAGTDFWIGSIQLRCAADALGWKSGASAQVVDLPSRGITRLPMRASTCPQGQFLVGWRSSVGQFVDSIQPICR